MAGRSTETPRGPGKRRVPPWRSEARCGRQGGIWRPVSWVRHPRRLKPSLAPSHAPRNRGVGGSGGGDAAPRPGPNAWGPEGSGWGGGQRGRGRLQAGAGGGVPGLGPARRPRVPAGRAGRVRAALFRALARVLRRCAARTRRPLCPRTPRAQCAKLRMSFPLSPPRGLSAKPTFGLKSKISQEAAIVGAGSFLRSLFTTPIRRGGGRAWHTKFLPAHRRGLGG